MLKLLILNINEHYSIRLNTKPSSLGFNPVVLTVLLLLRLSSRLGIVGHLKYRRTLERNRAVHCRRGFRNIFLVVQIHHIEKLIRAGLSVVIVGEFFELRNRVVDILRISLHISSVESSNNALQARLIARFS